VYFYTTLLRVVTATLIQKCDLRNRLAVVLHDEAEDYRGLAQQGGPPVSVVINCFYPKAGA